MKSRDLILAKLKAAAPQNPAPAPDVAAWHAARRSPESAQDKARRFSRNIVQAHAEVHLVRPGDWPEKLAQILRQKAIDSLLVSPNTPHGAQARQALAPLGIACPGYESPVKSWKETLFNATPAAFTKAHGAIAETGSLILWPDADEPRLMSLAPPVHIVLLDARHIYDTFFQAIEAEGWQNGLPTNLLLVSGPSKTADIQQTLAYGAHGPKELVVLMMEGDAP